jgi:hypothetical protein
MSIRSAVPLLLLTCFPIVNAQDIKDIDLSLVPERKELR